MVMVKGKIEEWAVISSPRPDDEVGSQAPLLPFRGATIGQRFDIDASLGTIANEILIGSVGDARLRIQSPIRVRFTLDAQQFVAEAVEFAEFGFGTNRSEALRDLQLAIVELYFTLEKEQGRLGPDLQNVWARLQERIHKR